MNVSSLGIALEFNDLEPIQVVAVDILLGAVGDLGFRALLPFRRAEEVVVIVLLEQHTMLQVGRSRVVAYGRVGRLGDVRDGRDGGDGLVVLILCPLE